MSNSIQMYGCDIDAFIKSATDSLTYKLNGANMIVAGLMSDAQELMQFGATEEARQYLNRAKAILFLVMDGQLIGTVPRA